MPNGDANPNLSKAPGATSLRIVLIEDSDSDVYLIGRAARELAYDLQIERFSSASHVLAQLEKIASDVPDGVLLDLNLPGGSGIEVLEKIRLDPRISSVPVVVMTSSMSPHDRESTNRLGVDGYLSKASNYKEFVQSVGIALELVRNPKRDVQA